MAAEITEIIITPTSLDGLTIRVDFQSSASGNYRILVNSISVTGMLSLRQGTNSTTTILPANQFTTGSAQVCVSVYGGNNFCKTYNLETTPTPTPIPATPTPIPTPTPTPIPRQITISSLPAGAAVNVDGVDIV